MKVKAKLLSLSFVAILTTPLVAIDSVLAQGQEQAQTQMQLQEQVTAATAPTFTTSRYMITVDSTILYNLGCQMGRANQSSAAILDFGQPWEYSDGNYGAIYPGATSDAAFQPTTQIAAAAKQFLQGHNDCSGPSAVLRLAIGTNNYGSGVSYRHGQAWGKMINNINAWATSKGTAFVAKEQIRGASDMELEWNSAANTRAWVDGYASVSNIKYYNYGDCRGCMTSGTTSNPANWTVRSQNGAQDYTWTQEDVWWISWGAAPANPLPEIYFSYQANQWQQMSLYSKLKHGENMTILGPVTQWQACQGQPNAIPCQGTLTPGQGWNELQNELNADFRTAQSLPYSTDMTWSNTP